MTPMDDHPVTHEAVAAIDEHLADLQAIFFRLEGDGNLIAADDRLRRWKTHVAKDLAARFGQREAIEFQRLPLEPPAFQGRGWGENIRSHMTRLQILKEEIIEHPGRFITPTVLPTRSDAVFVDEVRLQELRAVKNSAFDLKKLIQLCNELNSCYQHQAYLAVAMLTRAVLDHIPPIFGAKTFTEVVNNYAGTRSFKDSMRHLDASARKIADAHLHVQIRSRETLPTRTQVDFSHDVDVLLAEIIRIL